MKFLSQRFAVSLFLAVLLVSCSGGEKKSEQSKEQEKSLYSFDEALSMSDDSQVAEEVASSDPMSTSEDPAEESELSADSTLAEARPSSVEQSEEESGLSDSPLLSVGSESQHSDLSVYRVQEDNETLMRISFKIYGDYRRWREIAQQNSEMFDERYVVKKGMMLKFKVPENEFVWSPQGNPYVIRHGDTLSSISQDIYSTFRKWKDLWRNNRPLIRDPNKIFAGFTIYYVMDENSVDMAKKEVPVDHDREPTSL